MLSDKKNNLALLIFGALLFLAYLHPFHLHPYRSYYHEALVVFGLLITCAFLATAGQPRLSLPLLSLMPLAIFLLVLLQIMPGHMVQFTDVALPLMYFLLLAAAIVVGATLSRTPGFGAKICLMLALVHLAAGLLSVVMQGVQLSGVDAWPLVMPIDKNAQVLMRPYANVAQPNQLALLICLALAGLWYLHQQRRVAGRTAGLLALALLFGLALTQSRIGWIILPAFAFWCAATLPGGKPVSRVALGGLLLAYVAMVLSLPLLAQSLGYAGRSVAEHIGGRSDRMVLWRQAWSMAAEHPWIGVGWGTFGSEQVRIAADFSSTVYAEHAHNLILNFAAELGWPVTVLVFGLLAYWLWQTCIVPAQNVTIRFATLCFAAVLVHSMVEFPIWYAYVLIPAGLLMGMLHQLRWPSEGVRVPQVVLLAVFMMASLGLVFVSRDYQRVVFSFKKHSALTAQHEPVYAPAHTLFPQFFEYFRLMKVVPREGMAQDEIAFVERWTRRFGFVHTLNKLAEVYVLNGRPQQAGRAMLTLQRLHPDFYAEYYDYWQARAALDARYRTVFERMPRRDAP